MIDLPKDWKAIGCKWVLRKKLKFYGSLDKYKARTIAKRFTQVEWIDYKETFSPVVKFQSIQTLTAFTPYIFVSLGLVYISPLYLFPYRYKSFILASLVLLLMSTCRYKIICIQFFYILRKQTHPNWDFTWHKIGMFIFISKKKTRTFFIIIFSHVFISD